MAETHPDQAQGETPADREAREQAEARRAAIAAEIARQEAEAAQRKAEARAHREAVEGRQSSGVRLEHARGVPPIPPRPTVSEQPTDAVPRADVPAPGGAFDAASPGSASRPASGGDAEGGPVAESPHPHPIDERWERLRRAMAERTVLTGVIRRRKPFGVFVDLGGMEGLVRTREMRPEDTRPEAPGLQNGQAVHVVVIGMNEYTHRAELSMRRVGDPRTPPEERTSTGPAARRAEGPMALAFRLAREKKQQME